MCSVCWIWIGWIKYALCNIFLNLIFICYSDKGSGHGILEFSTDKAGQDVTPLNLEFDEPKQRSSTLNSITGESDYIFLSIDFVASRKRHYNLSLSISFPRVCS